MLVYSLYFVFFFVKQKTAYEMRISDWSSDVCSFRSARPAPAAGTHRPRIRDVDRGLSCWNPQVFHVAVIPACAGMTIRNTTRVLSAHRNSSADSTKLNISRSEEHTSELQSLMRISYAVFCLQKKTNKTRGHKRKRKRARIHGVSR